MSDPGRIGRAWRGEGLRSAAEVLVRYPGRSALTVLGLAIGVAAFIAMVSFGEGARRSVMAQFQSLGTNLLVVGPWMAERQARDQPAQPLGELDVAALRREATTLGEIAPVIRMNQDLERAGVHHFLRVQATTPGFVHLHDWPLAAGGMFDNDEVARRAKVCVLGATPARALFGFGDPLGGGVTIGGVVLCRVVGVLATKGYSTDGDDLDDLLLMPVTTFEAYWGTPEGYSRIELQPLRPGLMETAKSEVTEILARLHRIDEGEENDFRVTTPLEVLRAVERTSAVLTGLLRGIAAVSLLVGGIGIMNIQLVSVAERTREIGVRSAIGASPTQILTQFLWEGLALTLVGAGAGVLMGLAIAAITAEVMQWPRVISASGIAGAVAFALAVGMVFGFLPARRAAALDPIEALRHE
jgi:putative ABC transport system permease protein